MKKFLIAFLVLAGIALLIFSQLGRLEALTPQLARLRRNSALQQLGRLPEPVAAGVPVAPPAKSKRLEELIRRAPKVMGGVPLLMTEDLFSDYPQLEADFLKAKKSQLRLEFGEFFALARLTPAQIERYLEISLDGEREWIAQTKEAAARGVSLSDPAIKRLGQEGAARRKREREELLGPANLALWEQYREERPARRALKEMAKATAFGSSPLTAEQLNRLTALVTEAGVFDNDRPWKAVSVLSGAVGKSGDFLTPEQQELFELLIDARQAQLASALSRKVR